MKMYMTILMNHIRLSCDKIDQIFEYTKKLPKILQNLKNNLPLKPKKKIKLKRIKEQLEVENSTIQHKYLQF